MVVVSQIVSKTLGYMKYLLEKYRNSTRLLFQTGKGAGLRLHDMVVMGVEFNCMAVMQCICLLYCSFKQHHLGIGSLGQLWWPWVSKSYPDLYAGVLPFNHLPTP